MVCIILEGIPTTYEREVINNDEGRISRSHCQRGQHFEASAQKVLNAFTSSVTKALKKGDKLTHTGFGTFSVAKRRPRTGRDPRTEKNIKIPARKVAKFKLGNLLRSTLN